MSARLRVVRDLEVPKQRPYGLPAPLPADERLLWQGSPHWRGVARRVMHVRALAIYFGVLMIICLLHALRADTPSAWFSLGALGVLGSAAIGFLMIFAVLIARTTVYTLTDRRVVMRIGVALSASLNLPFKKVDQASLRLRDDGSGDIALLMAGEGRLGWIMLWPHVRPWRTQRVQPMLRCLPEASRVAHLLSEHLHSVTAKDAANEAGRGRTAGGALAAGG